MIIGRAKCLPLKLQNLIKMSTYNKQQMFGEIMRINATLKDLRCGAKYAAKSLQLCLTLCSPIDGSPPGYPVPGILQARTLEWVAISFSNAGK